jgi:hypothetical protein
MQSFGESIEQDENLWVTPLNGMQIFGEAVKYNANLHYILALFARVAKCTANLQ